MWVSRTLDFAITMEVMYTCTNLAAHLKSIFIALTDIQIVLKAVKKQPEKEKRKSKAKSKDKNTFLNKLNEERKGSQRNNNVCSGAQNEEFKEKRKDEKKNQPRINERVACHATNNENCYTKNEGLERRNQKLTQSVKIAQNKEKKVEEEQLILPSRGAYSPGCVKVPITLHSPKSLKSFDDLPMHAPFCDTNMSLDEIQTRLVQEFMPKIDDDLFQRTFCFVEGVAFARVSREKFKITVSDDGIFYKFALDVCYSHVKINDAFIYAKFGDPNVMDVIDKVSQPLLVQKKFFTVLQSVITDRREPIPSSIFMPKKCEKSAKQESIQN
eukprot:m.340110 g.340110  ORF g.340110 m.340110 type:complete len:327 (+) comp19137_c0_seq1:170-1150(+)